MRKLTEKDTSAPKPELIDIGNGYSVQKSGEIAGDGRRMCNLHSPLNEMISRFMDDDTLEVSKLAAQMHIETGSIDRAAIAAAIKKSEPERSRDDE